MDFDTAVAALSSQETWCRGAKALAQLGDHRAIVPLVRAYQSRAEGGKACLLEAMEALQPIDAAAELYDHNGPGERLAALFLMAYFRSDRHLPRLMVTIHDANYDLQSAARRALWAQGQTPKWQETVLPLLDDADDTLRQEVAESLALNPNEARKQAMRSRLAKETTAQVRAQLEASLKK